MSKMSLPPPPLPPPQQQVHLVFKPSACSCGTYFGNPYRLCGTSGSTHKNIQPSVFTFPTYYGNPYRPDVFKVQVKPVTTVYGNPYAGRVLHVYSSKLNLEDCRAILQNVVGEFTACIAAKERNLLLTL